MPRARATDPERFIEIFPDSGLTAVFQRRSTDPRSMLDDVRKAE